MGEPEIRSIEHLTLIQNAGADLKNPFPLALDGGGFALAFQAITSPMEPESPDFANACHVEIVEAASPEAWQNAQPIVVPDSTHAGNCPALLPLKQDRFLMLDWRWDYCEEDKKPQFGFRIPGHSGWVGFQNTFAREVVRETDRWTFGTAVMLSAPGENVVRTGPCAVRGADGALIVPAYCADTVKNQFLNHVFLMRSDDQGRTWTPHGTIDKREKQYASLTEAVILPVEGGVMTALVRTTNQFDYMLSAQSADNGRTWSLPVKTDIQGHPTDLVDMGNGVLACAYTVPAWAEGVKNPGIRICLSLDSGATWNREAIVPLRQGLPEGDLDRPRLLPLHDFSFLAVYHGRGPDGRYAILGTRFEIS